MYTKQERHYFFNDCMVVIVKKWHRYYDWKEYWEDIYKSLAFTIRYYEFIKF